MSIKELFITHKVASIITCAVIGTAAVGGAGYGIYAVNTANNATPVAEEVVSEEPTTVQDTVVTEAPVTTVEKEDKTEEVKEEKAEEVKEDTSKKEETSASKKNDSKTTTKIESKSDSKKSDSKSDTKTEAKTDNKTDTTKTETATSNTSNNSTSGNTASPDTKKNTGTSGNSNSSASTDTKNTFVDDGKGSSGKWHYETIHHDAVYETQTREVHHPEQGHWEVVDDSYYVTRPVYNTETQVIDGCEYPPGTLQVGTDEVYCPHESNTWIVDEVDHWETVTEQVMVKPAWDEKVKVYD